MNDKIKEILVELRLQEDDINEILTKGEVIVDILTAKDFANVFLENGASFSCEPDIDALVKVTMPIKK
ncbi:hypothetical protein [Pseudobacteroides cellulosolvens]|uniref:Uncharacterized protein n=1 Tax=Pseudobacteroides cellulosolvens ATCC 35603 = DSM 2933 TaxID=398512 RepID=A0A0L6JKW9_9FIRM|nr:hypothetical protein [Pseudobacteroides cellulosolvens]KNY26358.1 hypothetical protein Bccel_1620 [Pseudobacteroides cellulosolvens ATCC 35603 = DSM 2933]